MDPYRASHARSVEEAERMADALFVQLAKNVAAIIEDVGGEDGQLSMADYGAVMSRIDRELSRIYPQTPGGPSRLEEVVVLAANRARVRSIKANMAPVVATIKRVDPAFWKVIRADTN